MIIGNKDGWSEYTDSDLAKLTNSASLFQDIFDKMAKQIQDEVERGYLQECKDTGKISDVVLIANRANQKYLVPLKQLGLIKAILWSNYVEEDKIYQVTDPILIADIIKYTKEPL